MNLIEDIYLYEVNIFFITLNMLTRERSSLQSLIFSTHEIKYWYLTENNTFSFLKLSSEFNAYLKQINMRFSTVT